MSKPVWVFLRGLIRQHRHWEDFPNQFQKAFPDARIILLDLPGNGDLWEHESPSSVADMVESVREQLDRQQVRGAVHVLALSLGAMVAIEWMERYPCDIERAVLMNTSLRGMSSFTERLRSENYPDIFKSLISNSKVEREKLILDISTNLYKDKEALAQKWVGYADAHPTSRMNGLRQLFAAGTYKAPAARPHEHVLILQSLADHLVNPVCSTRIADTWRWPMVSHPSAGHDLTLDDGDWVIAQIQKWLAE
ncbi:MAG: alpha/beta hydrolase [Pedobacter sp.]|nr:alpha/beta hydrolase [Pedobacter sp.]